MLMGLVVVLISCHLVISINGIYVPSDAGIKTEHRNNLEPELGSGIRVFQNYTNVKIQQHENTDNLKKLYVDNYNQVHQQSTENPTFNEQFDLEPSKGYNRPQYGRIYQPYPQTGASQTVDSSQVIQGSQTLGSLSQTPQKYPEQSHGLFPESTQTFSPSQDTLCTINCIKPVSSQSSPSRGHTVQISRPVTNQPGRPVVQPVYPVTSPRPGSFYVTRKPLVVFRDSLTWVDCPPGDGSSDHLQVQQRPQNVLIPENYYSGRIQNVQQPQQPGKRCPPGKTGQFPYENSCHQFLNCWNGRGIIQNCAPGTLFNPQTLECDFPDKVQCLSGPRTARYEKLTVKEAAACPQSFSGMVPHYQDCAKFLNCNNGVQVEMACAPGTLFDAQTNVCDHAYKVQCVNQDQREVRYIESSKYTQGPIGPSVPAYEANWGNKQDQNSRTEQALSSTSSSNQGVKCPPGFAGLMPHPSDCSKFLSCANGMSFVMDCGPGTYFNPLISVCDHIRNVKCEQSQGPPSYHQNNQPNQGVNSEQYRPSPSQSSNVFGQYKPQGLDYTNGNYNPHTGVTSSDTYYLNQNQGQTNIPYHTSSNQGQLSQNRPINQWQTTESNYHNQNSGYQLQSSNSGYFNPNQGHTPYHPRQNQGAISHTQITYYSTRSTTTPVSTTPRGHQWNQNGHYSKPNQGGYNPSQQTNDDLDQQIEDLWQTIREPTTSRYETLTISQTTNRKKVWPPPFPTQRVDSDYHFEYDDLVEVDAPIKPLPPSKQLVQSVPGNVKCTNQTFDCGHHFCISHSSVCNGQKDCPSGADEQDCGLKLKDFIKTAGTKLAVKEINKLANVTLAWCAGSCSKVNCKGFNFRKHDGTCYILDSNVGSSGALIILPMYDYYENQEYTVDCSRTQGYLCKNQKCIPTSKLCDGINDCSDAQDEKGCNADAFNYKLRLVGDERHSGRLEVEVFGRVGYICDDMFGLKNADVACRELGFSLGAAEVRGNSFFAEDIKDNETVYLMDDVTCTGNETTLRDCDFNGWGISNCKPQEIVGVVCKTPLEICPKDHWKCKNNLECLPLAFVCDGVYDCTDKSDESGDFCEAPLKLRLTEGNQGRLEIMHNGIWGTVCDDDFNDDAAKVVCNQLGLSGSGKVVKDGQFGPGSGPIWLDQVFCRGNESAFENCFHWNWGEHNCEHSEDVGVLCNVKSVPGIGRRQKIDIDVKPDLEENTLPEKCGFRKDAIFNLEDHSDVHFRVVQAGTAQIGEYPWQASVRIKGKTKSAHWCGAIVVSSKYILTAAHCLVGYSKGAYFIVAGDYNVDKDEGTEQEAFIEDFTIHPKFGHGNKMNNDIALIRLKGKGLKITKDVQPVCLPPADYEYPVGLNCTISGFGSVESGKSKASRELRAGWVPILSKDVCQMPHVYGDAITEGMLCAGFMDNGVDACDGDSGGPLACLHEGVFKLFGITSWGQHCGYANKPGVYVNVAKYRKWIEDTMKELSK